MDEHTTHMPTVAVLMSTYNGERYLREQVDSILSQQGTDVRLFVRDDGSTDGTSGVLSCYSELDSVSISFGTNIGIGRSFWSLLQDVGNGYDYYAFSDQDDVWLEDKLISALRTIDGDNKKHLYISNQMCVDAEGNELGLAYHDPPRYELHRTIFRNETRGCTMVFDKYLYELLTGKGREPDSAVLKYRNHDFWVACVAGLIDSIAYDHTHHILYRQHSNNAVGAYKQSAIQNMKMRVSKVKTRESRHLRSRTARALYERYPEYLAHNSLVLLLANQKPLINRLKLVSYNYKYRIANQNVLVFALYTILGIV